MNKKLFFRIFFIGFCFLITSNRATAFMCPNDNGAGVGCTNDSYYCNNSCRQASSVGWCSGDFIKTDSGSCSPLAPGCDNNCNGSDGCGICNSCDSGFLLCSGSPGNKCAQKNGQATGVDANCARCTWSSGTSYTCTACGAGYDLSGGQCVAATLNLGPDSKTNSSVAGLTGLSPLVQSSQPFMYVGSAGISLNTSTIPMQTALNVFGASNFYNALTVGAPTAANHAVTKSYVDDIVLSSGGAFWASSTNGIYNIGLGNVGIGTISPDPTAKLHVNGLFKSNGGEMDGHLNMKGNNIIGIYKITVSIIDPLYDIQGTKYSTYAPSFVGGIKEELIDRGQISQCSAKICSWQLDFSKVKTGSDLWVWRKIVDFNEDKVDVLLTPYGQPAILSYEIKDNKIIFYADRPTQFSYRLVGSRYDWRDWPTLAVDQAETASMTIK